MRGRRYRSGDRGLRRFVLIAKSLDDLVSGWGVGDGVDHGVRNSEFGDYILETHVPVTKILFFNRLIPQAPLKGESEYMVIGGDYTVTASYL